jgi:hypothetical protein
LKLQPEHIVKYSSPQDLKNKVLPKYDGQVVVVVGHSGTLDTITQGFGGAAGECTDEGLFDNLCVISVYAPGKAGVANLKYGKPSSNTVVAKTTLESLNYPGYFVRHQDYRGKINPFNPSQRNLFIRDASFKQVAGLSAPSDPSLVSFESENYPGYYLRHRNYEIWLDKNNNTDLFRKDASFKVHDGLAQPSAIDRPYQYVSFESTNYPGYFIRHQNYLLRIDKDNGSQLFKKDATFFRRLGLVDTAQP